MYPQGCCASRRRAKKFHEARHPVGYREARQSVPRKGLHPAISQYFCSHVSRYTCMGSETSSLSIASSAAFLAREFGKSSSTVRCLRFVMNKNPIRYGYFRSITFNSTPCRFSGRSSPVLSVRASTFHVNRSIHSCPGRCAPLLTAPVSSRTSPIPVLCRPLPSTPFHDYQPSCRSPP